MTSINSNFKNLKRLNFTYQAVGILGVIGILWFPIFSWLGLLSIITLVTFYILILKFKNKVISVEIDEENNSLLFTFYTKKTKSFHIDQITYKASPGQVALYSNKKKVVNIEKYTWTNWELTSKFVIEKCERNNYKNEFKELTSEIIKEEVVDYHSNNV
ncbi:hypothetical protein [Carboxylicivirga sp. RSCT41]|uniref:hypothetical protein n=1 Tax=Carboxylicivirga agarovorans TaxID=3417570 RepID=UPI003D34195A